MDIQPIARQTPVLSIRASANLSAIVLIALVLLYSPFSAFICPRIEPLVLVWGETPGRILHELPRWFYMAAVLLLLVRLSGRPLRDIGLRQPGWDTLRWALIAVVSTFALALTLKALVAGIPHPAEDLVANAAELRWSWIYAGWVALRAGVVEEVLFRGVLIEQLAILSGRRWLGAILSGVIFVSAHSISFDWFQLLMASAATVALTLVYMQRRNLPATICAHVLIDLIGFSQLLLKTNTI